MNEKIILELKFDTKNKYNYSVSCNDYRVGGVKWNDVENGEYHKVDINVEDLLYTTKLLTSNQNQKAIECLEELKHYISYEYLGQYSLFAGTCEWIDNKIKELEGNKDAN